MTQWPVATLGEIADKSDGEIRTGPFGSQLHSFEYTDDPYGIPVVMPLNMIGGRLDLEGIARIPPARALELKAHATRVGDVLLSRRGDIGRYCFIDVNSAGALCGTGSLRVSIQESEQLLPEFLCLYLETAAGLHELQGRAVGSTMPNINAGIVRSFALPLPPLTIQRKVTALITAYDDLIENNTHRIKILEEMAARIYREWFLDLRYPGHEDVPLADSVVGPIPDGWTVGPLSSLSQAITRGVSPRYSDVSGEVVINQRCIRGGALDLTLARSHATTVPPTKFVRLGDILINSTGVGTLGRVAQVLFAPVRVTVDSHVTIVRPAPDVAGPTFLGMTLRERESELAALGVGSTGQTELGRGAIGEIKIVVPPLSCQREFSAAVDPIRLLSIALADTVASLRSTRDMLLPRLVSGEANVTDLDIAMPEGAA